jgi:hypothetical protein
MTRLEDRQTLVDLIAETRASGSRQAPARAQAGVDPRTFQRWRKQDGTQYKRRPWFLIPESEACLFLSMEDLSTVAEALLYSFNSNCKERIERVLKSATFQPESVRIVKKRTSTRWLHVLAIGSGAKQTRALNGCSYVRWLMPSNSVIVTTPVAAGLAVLARGSPSAL